MKWYFSIQGAHVRVRVFMNGAHCGNLTFRKEEFEEIQTSLCHRPYEDPRFSIEFAPEDNWTHVDESL